MNSFSALRYSPYSAHPLQTQITATQLADLHATAAGGFLLHVISHEDLRQLETAALAPLLRPFRSKNDHKALSARFRPSPGIARIHATYRTAGGATHSLNAFLKTAREKHFAGLCLVGVPAPVFASLWQHAPPPAPTGEWDRALDGVAGADYMRVVLEQTADLPMPSELPKKFIGNSVACEVVRRLILCAAKYRQPVLIEGETGTGKEVVARMIHECGPLRTQTFVPVNCGGIPPDLMESELFGHVKGAFTHAVADKKGLLTLAQGSTLFLDEIGDLSLHHQVKILRALENGEYRAVGSDKLLHTDARIIAASNRDLKRMVGDGRFREDLYYRLFVLRIQTPALREHRDDIPALANHFWKDACQQHDHPLPSAITDELKRYPWPGNARELRAFLMNVFALTDPTHVTLNLVRAVYQERTQPLRPQLVDR